MKELEARDRKAGRSARLTLVASSTGLFMGMLDNTVVNVSLPTMRVELDADVSGLQWVVDAYVLAFACLVLTGGALGDRHGRKRAFQAGLALFTASSVLCGLAPGLGWLIAGRTLQGAGTALMLPNSLSVLTAAFPDERERAQAIGLWAGISALALGIGPVLGGLLTQTLGWESVFFVNLPVGLAALVLAQVVITDSRSPAPRPLDPLGQVLAVVTLASLTFALIEGNQFGWHSPLILGLLVVATLGAVAFVLAESSREAPFLELAWFRYRRFAGANLIGLLQAFALYGFIFFNGLYFQEVLDYPPARAGLASLANTLVMVVVAPLAGRLAGRFGFRPPVLVGTLAAGTAFVLFQRTGTDTSFASLWWNLSLMGIGFGLINSPVVAAAQASLPGGNAGIAAGMLNAARQTGGVLSIALLGAVATLTANATLPGRLEANGVPEPVAQLAVAASSGELAANVPPEAAGAATPPASGGGPATVAAVELSAKESFVRGMHVGYLLAALALYAGTAAAAVLLRPEARPGRPNAPPGQAPPHTLGPIA